MSLTSPGEYLAVHLPEGVLRDDPRGAELLEAPVEALHLPLAEVGGGAQVAETLRPVASLLLYLLQVHVWGRGEMGL